MERKIYRVYSSNNRNNIVNEKYFSEYSEKNAMQYFIKSITGEDDHLILFEIILNEDKTYEENVLYDFNAKDILQNIAITQLENVFGIEWRE